jgi:LacI family transcriptional regulator
MATSKDVARLAGTSIATVSYVLNNGPRPVSETTRARVLDAAKQLGYKPNAAARALITGKTATFGLVVPSILNPFFGELSHAFEEAARQHDHLLLIADSDMDPDQEELNLEAFVNRRVDGVVLVSCAPGKPSIDILGSNNIPVVALHPMKSHSGTPTVHMDYVAAAKELAQHLIDTHRARHLLLVLAKAESGSAQHEEGVKAAVSEIGPEVKHEVLETEVSRADVFWKIREYLQTHRLPEAIYCATDEQAYGVLAALSALDFKVPDDVKVVGFDGTLHSEFAVPSLTSVRQPLEEIASRAIEILLGLREPSDQDGRLAGKLLVRRSCGC